MNFFVFLLLYIMYFGAPIVLTLYIIKRHKKPDDTRNENDKRESKDSC